MQIVGFLMIGAGALLIYWVFGHPAPSGPTATPQTITPTPYSPPTPSSPVTGGNFGQSRPT